MILCLSLYNQKLVVEYEVFGAFRVLEAHSMLTERDKRSEHQTTWLKKFSSRKCFSLPDLGTYQKSSKSLFSQSSNHLWLVILLFWAVTQSSEKERLAGCFYFSLSQVWSRLPLHSRERIHPCTHLSLSSPRPSKEQEGESHGREILFSINYTGSKQEKLSGRGILSAIALY